MSPLSVRCRAVNRVGSMVNGAGPFLPRPEPASPRLGFTDTTSKPGDSAGICWPNPADTRARKAPASLQFRLQVGISPRTWRGEETCTRAVRESELGLRQPHGTAPSPRHKAVHRDGIIADL